jgi:hypothetical protein
MLPQVALFLAGDMRIRMIGPLPAGDAELRTLAAWGRAQRALPPAMSTNCIRQCTSWTKDEAHP